MTENPEATIPQQEVCQNDNLDRKMPLRASKRKKEIPDKKRVIKQNDKMTAKSKQ